MNETVGAGVESDASTRKLLEIDKSLVDNVEITELSRNEMKDRCTRQTIFTQEKVCKFVHV